MQFSSRLEAAGETILRRAEPRAFWFEDRQDLPGHSSGRFTTHYGAPDIVRLLQAVNSIYEQSRTTVLRLAGVDGRIPAIPPKRHSGKKQCSSLNNSP